jgi:hypothetical protein
MTDYSGLIQALKSAAVDFIVVGGFAGVAHGSARQTNDLDIVYLRTSENIARLADCLAPLSPALRGAPKHLPFLWDREAIANGLNFTLTTRLGDLDLLGEITGGGTYSALLPHTITLKVFGLDCLFLDLETLIRVKRAAGRPRDFEAVAELEALLAERKSTQGD